MRPIDADEVRKRQIEAYQGNGVELETIMVVPVAAIDRAPTVSDRDLDKIKAIVDEYYLNVADKDSTDIKAYLFDKILNVFANED